MIGLLLGYGSYTSSHGAGNSSPFVAVSQFAEGFLLMLP